MHTADLDNPPAGATSVTPGHGRLSMTDSESEDLELSSWSHDGTGSEDGGKGRKKKKKKKRQTRRERKSSITLGDRVVMDPPGGGGVVMDSPGGGGVVISKADKKAADLKVLRNIAANTLFIGLW